MGDSDSVTIVLGGVTHEFPAARVRISVVESSDRGGLKSRYATLVVDLSDGEFPEDVSAHLARMRDE